MISSGVNNRKLLFARYEFDNLLHSKNSKMPTSSGSDGDISTDRSMRKKNRKKRHSEEYDNPIGRTVRRW